jgi:hypothetical protein
VAAAVVVVAAAAVALGLAWPGPSAPGRPAASPPTASQPVASPPSPSSGAPSEQAAAVSAVLASSAATRAALRGAVRQVRACRDLSHAVSQLRTVVSQRITESRQAAALATAALPDGAAVKSELASALRTSMRADRDYLTWAQQQQAACTPSGQSAAYSIALRANQAANAAKQAFARIWNRVATKYGLRPIRPDGF